MAIRGRNGPVPLLKSRAVAELTDAAIATIADLAERSPTPITDIVIWHHGGCA